MFNKFSYSLLCILFFLSSNAQIVINEAVSTNTAGITDEDGDYVDWIELYNNSSHTINLEGYIISDRNNAEKGWVLPALPFTPKSYLVVFASGKNRKTLALNYQTIIDLGDQWQYAVPPSNKIREGWRLPGFNASDWQTGPSGFGYGDGDDNTIIQPLQSIYIRKTFQIEDPDLIESMLLHVDYDDGFLAFINGNLVAQGNTYFPDALNFENVQVNTDREALIYQGGLPVRFKIEQQNAGLKEGENVLAIQGYNVSTTSSDFSLIPFFTIGSTSFSQNNISQLIGSEGEGGLHTDFSINKDGESVYLFNASGILIDSMNIPPLKANIAYGRYPDGSNTLKYFPTPTPGQTNTNPVDELRDDKIFFSSPSGFYNQTINISLSASANDVTIRYTSDGSEPNTNSPIYSNSINISSTRVIRAATFYMGQRSGEVYTNTYFKRLNHKLPVVSISSNPKNFFDYDEGILVEGPNAQAGDPKYGANYWMDWEKPISFEYFDKAGERQIEQQAGIKVFGGWSRMSAQKSMAVYARNIYGDNRFKYPFFADRKHTEYKAFLLRNSGNDWQYTMLRDGYVSELVKALDVDRLAFQPTVVYLNGEYWGILNMREKPNEHYLAANHGVDPDEVNRLEVNRSVIQGSGESYNKLINFINNASLQNDEEYQWVADNIDISCFIDYQLIQIYVNNRDWPGNNIKFWNTNKAYSKWRWILYDTDFGLNLYNNSGHTENSIEFATAPYNSGWPNPEWSTLLLRRLLTSDTYKHQFINRMADLLNTVFDPTFANYKLDSLTMIVEPEIDAHRKKWGPTYITWFEQLDFIYSFNENRPTYVQTHFEQFFNLSGSSTVHLTVSNQNEGQIQVSTIVPDVYPFSGFYFNDVPITFKALPKPGYKFVRWENASNSTQSEITLSLKGRTRLHAIFEPALSDNYNIVINEINYRSHDDYDSGEWIELYNSGNQTVNLEGWKISDQYDFNAFTFQKGDVIYPGGFMVAARNTDQFTSVHPKAKPLSGNFIFGLSSSGETISLFDAAGNLIDWVNYQTQSPWPVEPLESAATLELKKPGADKSVPESWQAGPPGGTPGQNNSSYTSTIQHHLQYHQASCFPTRFADYTTLRFFSPEQTAYSISILDIQGRVINKIDGSIFEQGTHYIDIFTEQEKYKRGIYLVKLQTQLGVETLKVIKQ